jgi:acyl carrier protein
MSATTSEAVRTIMLERLAASLRGLGIDAETVDDDFDLLHNGVVDSLGLLNLLGDVDDALGVTVDYEGLDAADLGRVGALCRYIADHAGG